MDKSQTSHSISLSSLKAPWNHNENVIWLASTLRLYRNIEKFAFPHKLEQEKKKHILSLALRAFQNVPELVHPMIIRSEDMAANQKEFLIEHFLISEGFQEAHQGTAFGLDETGELLAIFNIKDHLQLQYTETSGDLEKGWQQLVQIENGIQQMLNFAFLPKFGFLTSDPMHCGTGLVVQAYLHLPAIIHTKKLADCQERERKEGILFYGLQGNPDELIGDIVVLKNGYTLGMNEETILSTLRNAILRLVIAEKSARSKIKSETKDGFKDRVAKALGLLKYSYQLEAQEALNAISMLKFGIELGWIKGMTVREANELFFDCRRVHLAYHLHETNPTEDIAMKRAQFLRKATESVSLNFS